MENGTFIEVSHFQLHKHDQGAAGDTFLSQKQESDGRVITVLSDGLGSGIKAGVLSTLTATMAMKFVAAHIPIKRAAGIIMNTLPVCKERGMSYATFTLVDIEPNATVRIMEYDNPAYLLVRDGSVTTLQKEATTIERKNRRTAPARESVLYYSSFHARPGDRLLFFSDGVTQSGMGSRAFPMGWGAARVEKFVVGKLIEHDAMSARALARMIVQQAQQHDGYSAKDDITCGVIYFRHPRDLLIMTGPPINPEHDLQMALDFKQTPGRKIVCGGTTANILARQLGVSLVLHLKNLDPVIPPISAMDGADLVTEGIITLSRVAEMLERGAQPGSGNRVEFERENGATKIVELLLESDRISFVVGTKINDAHQDPLMPVEVEIRCNVVKRIRKLLTEHYLKEVTIRYI